MHEKQAWIREKIRKRWLLGKRPDGSMIGLYRDEGYAEYKLGLNNEAGFGNVDLTLTGALGRGIRISGFNDEYEVFSEDQKYESIVERYGYYNFNITEQEKNELFDKILSIILLDVMEESYALL